MKHEPFHILLIEDDPDDVLLIREALSENGNFRYQLQHEDCLSDGLDQLARNHLDVGLLDLNLPDSRGLETLTQFIQRAPALPLVVLSGLEDEELAIEAVRQGAQDYLVKGHLDSRELPRVLRYAIERQRVEQRMRLQSAALEAAENGIMITDSQGIIQWVNPAFSKLTGYGREVVIGQSPSILKSDMQDVAFYRQMWESITAGETWHGEFINKRATGELYTEEQTITPMKNQTGEVTHFIAVQQDITERKQKEAEIRQKNDDLAIINALNQAVNRGDSLIEITTSLAEEIKQALNSLNATVYLLSDDRQKLVMQNMLLPGENIHAIEKLIKGPIPKLIYCLDVDSSYRQIVESGMPRIANGPDEIRQIISTITEIAELPVALKTAFPKLIPLIQKSLDICSIVTVPLMLDGEVIGILETSYREPSTEAKLRRIEIIASQLLSTIQRKRAEDKVYDLAKFPSENPNPVLRVDHDGHICHANPASQPLLELWQVNVGGRMPDDLLQYSSEVLATGQIRELDIPCGDRHFAFVLTPIKEGDYVNWYGSDITARVQFERDLLRSEERYRTLAEAAHDSIFIIDQDDRIEYLNSFAARLLGGQPEDFIGQPRSHLFSSSAEDSQRINLARVAQSGEPFYVETETDIPSGKVWLGTWLVPIRDLDGEINSVLGVSRDITERKLAEMAVQRQLKELTIQHKIASAGVELSSEDEIVRHATEIIYEAFSPVNCGIFLFDEMRSTLVQHPSYRVAGERELLTSDLSQGVIGWVADSGQTMNVADVRAEPCYRVLDENVRSELCVPLKTGSYIMGVINIECDRLSAFSKEDVRLVSTLANQLATGIEKSRLFENSERRLQILQALRNIDVAITGSLDLRITLEVLLDQVLHQLNVDAAVILLLNEHIQQFEYEAGKGFHSMEIRDSKLRLGEGYAGKAALERQILTVLDLKAAEPPFVRQKLIHIEQFVSYVAAPLISKGQVKGLLEVYCHNPLDPDKEWYNYLETIAGQAAIAIDNAGLFSGLQRANTELSLAYDTTLEGWSNALELRDMETEGHSSRVTEMVMRLAEEFSISQKEMVHIRRGALLHDIGKMGIPDSILHKPGPLNDDEWEIMKKHPLMAFRLLSPISYLKPALDIPYCHHERWDGSGYPRGLKGEQIPLAARIFAVVDAWDALSFDRPYREAWPHEKVLAYLQDQAGIQFDPQVVEKFIRLNNEMA